MFLRYLDEIYCYFYKNSLEFFNRGRKVTEMSIPRREIKTRDAKWAQNLAKFIAQKTNITPNAISVLSVFFGFVAFLGYCCCVIPRYPEKLYFLSPIVVILGIQCRLICNLIDGMVAIEGGKHSVIGGVYNEFPDRVSDTFIIVGAGIAGLSVHSIMLGMIAALLAVLTAYTRLLGGTVGADQYFVGPMAKQHRMALLTVTAFVSLFQPLCPELNTILYPAVLFVIALGCVITVWRRLNFIKKDLETKEQKS